MLQSGSLAIVSKKSPNTSLDESAVVTYILYFMHAKTLLCQVSVYVERGLFVTWLQCL